MTDTEIKIGGIIAASGAVAGVSGPFRKGYDAWIRHYNTKGGVNGRKLKVIWQDTGGNSAAAADAARNLVENQKVFAIVEADPIGLGPACDYLQKQNVPIVGGGSAHNCVFQTPVAYHMGNQYNGVAAQGGWAIDGQRGSKFAVMYQNLTITTEAAALMMQKMEERGHKPVYKASVPVGTPDMSPYVTEARRSGADAILFVSETGGAVTLLQTLERQDWHPYVNMPSAGADDAILKAASPKTLEGLEVNFPLPAWIQTGNPGIDLYNQVMKAVYGDVGDQSVWVVKGFAAALLMTTTLENMGPDVTRGAMMNWLNQQDQQTLAALNPALGALVPQDHTYIPLPNGTHAEPNCSNFYRVKDGKFVPASNGWYCMKTN